LLQQVCTLEKRKKYLILSLATEYFLSVLENITTGSGDYPASTQWAPEVKRPRREADH
jgi:hypothetical protein